MPKKYTCTLRIDQFHLKSVEQLVFLHRFWVSTRCRFQNVPVRVLFSKSTVFKIFQQTMCHFRVNGRPICHIFHRFWNVPPSCEHSLGGTMVPLAELIDKFRFYLTDPPVYLTHCGRLLFLCFLWVADITWSTGTLKKWAHFCKMA